MLITIYIISYKIQYLISNQFFKKTCIRYMLEKLVSNYFLNVLNFFYIVVL